MSATYVAGTAALALVKNPALMLSGLEAKLVPTKKNSNPKLPNLLDAAAAVGR